MSDEVELLHADKHENFLQIHTMIFDQMLKHSQSSQNSKFCNVFTISVGHEVDFLSADKHQSFLQVDFNTWSIKVWYYFKVISLLIGWSRILKLLKISLQYLRKEVRVWIYFLRADKHESFYKLALRFLMEVARHVQSTQNRKLAIFSQYIKTKV